MRRGLMAWDREEVPLAAMEARLARLRDEMRRDGVDAFVAYTNIARGAAVCWLTGFTPYWNEGFAHVGATGKPLFATALSKRVAEWILSVMPLGDVMTTPRPSALIGGEIAKSGAKRIGILELEDFPAGHAQAILQAVPGLELVDATETFARARDAMDDVELRLLATADKLADAACAAVEVEAHEARDFIAPAESVARLGGAEECFALVAADMTKSGAFLRTESLGLLGATYAARVSLAYKGVWTRRTRSFARDATLQSAFDKATEALERFSPRARDSLGADITRYFGSLGRIAGWLAERPRGSYPLAPAADLMNAPQADVPAAPFVLNLELEISGARWIGARLINL